MNEDVKDLHRKIDKLDGRLDNVDKTLVAQHESLKLHMYRTDQNEERIKNIEDAIMPIMKHVSHVEGGLKLLGIVSIVFSIALTLYKFLI